MYVYTSLCVIVKMYIYNEDINKYGHRVLANRSLLTTTLSELSNIVLS